MRNVLLACKQLSFNFDEERDLAASESGEPQIHALIFDVSLEHSVDWDDDARSSACKRKWLRRRAIAGARGTAALALLAEKRPCNGQGSSRCLSDTHKSSRLRVPEDARRFLPRRRHDKACPRQLCVACIKSKEELRLMRIYKWFDEINEMPVVFHWKYRMEEIDPPEEVKIGLAQAHR